MEHVNFIMNQIGKSYDQMANFQIMPGVSLLGFCLAILLLHTLVTVFLVNFEANARADRAERIKQKRIKRQAKEIERRKGG